MSKPLHAGWHGGKGLKLRALGYNRIIKLGSSPDIYKVVINQNVLCRSQYAILFGNKVQLVIYESLCYIPAFPAYILVAFPLILKTTLKPKAFTTNIMRTMSYGVGMSDNPQDIRSMKELSLWLWLWISTYIFNEWDDCMLGQPIASCGQKGVAW